MINNWLVREWFDFRPRHAFRSDFFINADCEAIRVGARRLVEVVVIAPRHDFADGIAPLLL